jgi:hypothetical protein
VERMEEAGSGGTAEVLAWIAALPFTTGPTDVLGYAPSVAWRTGTGMRRAPLVRTTGDAYEEGAVRSSSWIRLPSGSLKVAIRNAP